MIYVINYTLFTAFFWLLYRWWFKKETFFKANRILLLGAPLLALVLPFLSFSTLNVIESDPLTFQLPEFFLTGSAPQAMESTTVEGLTTTSVIKGIYLMGVGLSLGFFLLRLSHLYHLKKRGSTENRGGYRLVHVPKSDLAFSFLNHIFVGTEISLDDRANILTHEQEHLRQKHSYDLLYYELLRIVTWFNPFVYLLQNELAEVHEFSVDREVTRQHSKKAYVESLLNANFKSRKLTFIHPFINKNTLKNRIMMLYKKSSSQRANFKFLMLLPLIFVMLTYVSCVAGQNSKSQPETNETRALSETDKSEDVDSKKVRFREVEKSPEFMDAPVFEDEEARKEALGINIMTFVNENFDVEGMREYAEKGVNRIAVEFTIGVDGKIQAIKAKSKVTELETEAIRVVQLLPQMKSGEQDGKPVAVTFALPIVFQNK